MKTIYKILVLLLISQSLYSQKFEKPKLVVGVVIDQMRYDYLEKFYNDFDDEGAFKLLLEKGSNFSNCTINYIPTVTGVGHSAIYTGTTPYYNGIIANDWKDKNSDKIINCCLSVKKNHVNLGLGIDSTRSPERLMSTTIGDQLKLSNYGKSKVYSVSLKDRGALLPAGKSADGAFWYNDSNGKFISSFYYFNKLPNWVKSYNDNEPTKKYLNKEWTLLKPQNVYANLPEDNSPYETDVFNEGRTSFPHSLKNVELEEKYKKLAHTPFGNQLLVDFTRELLKNVNLGQDEYTDLLAISFSSTDKIGHDYAPHSYEVKDTYLRLDLQLKELINLLDRKVGENNYTLFLTSDHGAMENISLLHDMNFDTGVLEKTDYMVRLNNYLQFKYKTDKIIKTRFSRNIYLNNTVIDSMGLTKADVEKAVKNFLINEVPEIQNVYTRTELDNQIAARENKNYLLNGFNPKRSGDILYSVKANSLIWEKKFGAQHGSGHQYDNHIPLIFYGKGIPSQKVNDEVYIVDIAATISDLLDITKPSDCIGVPLL